MIVYDSRGKQVAIGESIGRGGEAAVYRLHEQPGRLAKLYEPAPRPNYAAKLAWMAEHPPANPTRDLAHASLAWPDGMLFDSHKKLVGYTMPHIEHALSLLDVFNPRRRAEVLPSFDRRYLHRTARNLAAALSALHRSGYVAGDINESNVLVTRTALVTLIDTDSFQVSEVRKDQLILHPCPVGKPEYTPPELQGRSLAEVTRLPDHDAFGLAVLIFQLLMEGSHPFRAQWLATGDPPALQNRILHGMFPYAANPAFPIAPPKRAPGLDTLHPWLAELFRRTFVDGHQDPRYRAGPDLWLRAISEAEQSLVCCAQGHFYGSHLESCPYCALSLPKPAAERPSPNAAKRSSNPETPRGTWPGKRPSGWGVPPYAQPRPTTPSAAASGAAGVGAARATGFPSPFGSWPGVGFGSRQAGARRPAQGVGLRARNRLQPIQVSNWIRQRTLKSITIGGAYGALAGALPGAFLALVYWSAVESLPWVALFAAGGVAGGMLRGWNPGHRLGALVNRYVGWKNFWQFAGMFAGGLVGLMFGLVFIWAIIPVFLGLILGAQSGRYIGTKLYQLGNLAGWERIWGGLSALCTAAMGYGVARLAGALFANNLGDQLALWLLPTTGNGEFLWAMIWTLAGAFGGGLAGMLSGIFADLLGRLSGLVD